MNLQEVLSKLNEKVMQDPDNARAIFDAHPELAAPVLGHLYKDGLAQKARSEDTPEAFAAYCELIDGNPPPAHTMRQIRKVYADHAEGTGTVIHAFRGSRKTTYWGVKFLSFRIGKEPAKTNIATGAVDDSPEKVMKSVAAIIEFHPEWKRVFPNVVPDTGRGWSMEGYFVKDASMDYNEWVKKQSSTIDPTFLGGGYESRRLNGKHPSGVLYIDDIHDINNNSDKQRRDVVKALTSVILKTVIRKDDKLSTWVLGVGVPWASDDGYQTMVNSGYGYTGTPAMTRAQPSEPGAIYMDGLNKANGVTYDDLKGWWKLTYPEIFGVNSIMQERSFGKADFWQMIMLDLATASTGRLIYHQFPHEQIDPLWVMYGGCDPTTFEVSLQDKKGSHFALCYLAKRPGGGAVIVDGVLEKCSLLTAENHILSAQSKFPNWQVTAVENVSVGKVFFQSLQRNALIRIVLSGLKGINDARIRSKKERWANDAAKWFEDGTVLISDADTPFLNALRRLFNYFYDLDESDPAFDASDSTYHAMKQIPDVLRRTDAAQEQRRRERQRTPHPLAHIGAYTGYGRN